MAILGIGLSPVSPYLNSNLQKLVPTLQSLHLSNILPGERKCLSSQSSPRLSMIDREPRRGSLIFDYRLRYPLSSPSSRLQTPPSPLSSHCDASVAHVCEVQHPRQTRLNLAAAACSKVSAAWYFAAERCDLCCSNESRACLISRSALTS